MWRCGYSCLQLLEIETNLLIKLFLLQHFQLRSVLSWSQFCQWLVKRQRLFLECFDKWLENRHNAYIEIILAKIFDFELVSCPRNKPFDWLHYTILCAVKVLLFLLQFGFFGHNCFRFIGQLFFKFDYVLFQVFKVKFELIWIVNFKFIKNILKFLMLLYYSISFFGNVTSLSRLFLYFFSKSIYNWIQILNLWLHQRKFCFYWVSARLQQSNVATILTELAFSIG